MLEAKRTEERASTVSEENKAIMRRIYEEIFNEGKLELADELIAPEMVNHTAPGLPAVPNRSRVSLPCCAAPSPTTTSP